MVKEGNHKTFSSSSIHMRNVWSGQRVRRWRSLHSIANVHYWFPCSRDQLLESQRRDTKQFKWTLKFFEHLLSVTCVNCLIIKRYLSKENLSMLDFKMELLLQLRITAVSKNVLTYKTSLRHLQQTCTNAHTIKKSSLYPTWNTTTSAVVMCWSNMKLRLSSYLAVCKSHTN